MKKTFDEQIAEIAETQHGLVTREQAGVMGAKRGRIRDRVEHGRWRAIDRDVYVVAGSPSTWHQRMLAAVLAVGTGALAARRSAASLHGLPGFPHRSLDVVVGRPCQGTSRHAHVVQSTTLPVSHSTVVDAVPTTSVARTIFDLAATVRRRRTERALDHALAYGITGIEALWDVFLDLARRGRAGTPVMRALLLDRGPGYVAPASELEARLLELVAAYGLPRPTGQVDVGDGDGWIGRIDFHFPGTNVFVETDGRRHHTALLDLERDRARVNRLEATGRTILRLTWRDIVDAPDDTAALIARALRSKAA